MSAEARGKGGAGPAAGPGRRIALIVATVLAAAGFVAALAWRDAVHPLRYLRADRVMAGRAATRAPGGARAARAARDLSAGEVAELCRALAAGRTTGPVSAPAAIRVELDTVDFGRVEVEDLSGPGARAALFAGDSGGRERRFTLRSDELGRVLARLRAELEGGAEGR